jgi:hypothetical protein
MYYVTLLQDEKAEQYQMASTYIRNSGVRLYEVMTNPSPTNGAQSDVQIPGTFIVTNEKFIERYGIAVVKKILGGTAALGSFLGRKDKIWLRRKDSIELVLPSNVSVS